MRAYNKYILISFFCFAYFSLFAQSKAKIDKKVDKVEDLIELGHFYKANKQQQKIAKRLAKDSTSSPQEYLAFFLLREAQIEAAIGVDYDNFKPKVDKALSALSKEKEHIYLRGLIKAIQIEMKCSHFREAEKLLKTAQLTLNKKPNIILQSRVDFLLMKFYYSIGEYNKALGLSENVYAYFNKQVASKAKQLQVNTLNSQAQILIEQGRYFEADSVLEFNKPLVVRYTGERSAEYVDYLFLKGMVSDILGRYDDSFTYLEEAYDKIQYYLMGYSNTAHNTDELLEYISVTYWSLGDDQLADETRDKYSKNIEKHYKNFKFTNHEVMLLDIKREIVYGDFEQAQKLLQTWLTGILPTRNDLKLSSRVYQLKYFTHLALGELDEAEGSLDTLIQIESKMLPDNCPAMQAFQMQKGIFYVEYRQELNKASNIYKNHYFKELELELSHSHMDNIYYKNVLSNILEQKDALKHAKKVMKQVVQTVDSYYGNKFLITPEQHVNFGKLLVKMGNYEEAKKELEIGEKIYRENFPDAPEFAVALRYLARYYITVHDYEKAEVCIEEAQQVFKRLEYADYEADDVSEFAMLYIRQGQYHKVEDVLAHTINDIYQKYDSTSAKLVPEYNKLAELYLATGQFVEAEEINKIAINLAQAHYGKRSLAYGESVLLRGKIYKAIGNHKKAIKFFGKGIKILEKVLGKDHLSTAYAYQDLGLTLLAHDSKKNANRVEELLTKAYKIVKSNLGENNIAYAKALQHLASYKITQDEYDEALEYLESCEDIWTNIEKEYKNPEGSAEIYLLMAEITQYQNKTAEAIKYYSKAINAYEKVFDEFHPKYLHAKSQMGRLYFAIGEDIQALELLNQTTKAYLSYIDRYFYGLSEREKMQFWQMIKADFEFYNSVAFKNKKQYPEAVENVYNFRLVTKSLLLNSSLKVRKQLLNSKDEKLATTYKEWAKKRDLLVKHKHITSARREKHPIPEEQLLAEINQLEKELNKEGAFAETEHSPTYRLKDIRNSLEENQCAVEIVRYRYYKKEFSDSIIYVALVLDPSKSKKVQSIILGNGKDMESKYFSYYTNTFKHQINDTLSYSVYWKKIHEYIGDNKEVFLSLDGIYNQINIDALQIRNKEYVLDKMQIALVSTPIDIIKIKKRKESKTQIANNAILMGNPTFYATGPKVDQPSVANLPGAEQEVNTIEQLLRGKQWSVKSHINLMASEEKFKNIKGAKVLHIATHGFFIPDVDKEDIIQNIDDTYHTYLRSGLILTDGGYVIDDIAISNGKSENGILTAYEVMNLTLDNTELVVLSACETGVGNVQIGEGVYGLQRAFLVAGAESVIMSLFKVPDEVTAQLMTQFYTNWLASGNKREAFKKAKQAVRKTHPDPYYWGGFVLIER